MSIRPAIATLIHASDRRFYRAHRGAYAGPARIEQRR